MAVLLLLLGLVWLLSIWFLRQRYLRRPRHTTLETTSSASHLPASHASAYHLDILAGGLLFLGVLAFFWRTLSGDVYQPADGGDLVSFLYPTYRFAAEQLAQGTLPLWNSTLYGGAPFISDIQAGFLYLPHLLLFLAWPDFPYFVLQWSSALHLYWAGLGMYVLLRTLVWGTHHAPNRLSRPAAMVGAIAFQFSDPLLIHFGNLNLIAVLSWLPWVMAAFSRACDPATIVSWRTRLAWAALAGILFAIGNYAGHAQSSLYIAMAVAIYALFSIGLTLASTPETVALGPIPRPENRQREVSTRLAALAVTGTLTLLLTAPILLPALELSRYTSRSDFTYQDAIAFSMAPTQAIGLVTPGFFGRGPALHWSLWDRVQTPYAGVATLLLAVGGLALAAPHHRRRLLIWLGIGLFGFLLALGVYATVHGWLTWAFPPFGQLRAPARALILWTFGLSVLAAYGLDAIRLHFHPAAGPRTHGYLTFIGRGAWLWPAVILPLAFLSLLLTQADETAFLRASVAALALCIAAALWIAYWALLATYRAGWFGPLPLGILMVALLYLDLAATGAYTDISSTDPTRGYHHPQTIEFLTQDPDLFRIDTRTGMEHLWQPDTAALHGLQDVDGIANPLMLQHWASFWESTGGRHTRHYDLLNVKYVLVEGETPLPEEKFVRVQESPTGITVYENVDFLPRARLVHHVEITADHAEARTRIEQGDWDPIHSVLLTATDAIHPIGDSPPGLSQAAITHYGSSELTIQVNAAVPGYLVLSEVWYPGWHATVNGAPAPIVRANYAQRAVPVPAGDTTVHLWFRPTGWTWGVVAAVLGILISAAIFIAAQRGTVSPAAE